MSAPTKPRHPFLRRDIADEMTRASLEVAQLERPALAALAPVLAQAQRETASVLRAWLAAHPGDLRYTAARHTVLLGQLSRAMATVRTLDPVLYAALVKRLPAGAAMAARHTVHEIVMMERRFEGMPVALPLNVTRILATGERAMIPRFRTSAARYAGNVGDDIRRELAVGVIRGESIFEMTTRLARLGGPRGAVALQGVVGDRSAIVEQIGEGLFRRYRYWGERVARTETQAAYNTQVDESLREARALIPDLRRRWDASLDLRVCVRCRELHGTTADIGGEFPGGYTDAPAHPCCRCRCGAWRDAWAEFFAREAA